MLDGVPGMMCQMGILCYVGIWLLSSKTLVQQHAPESQKSLFAYDDLVAYDPDVSKAIRGCARAIAKCDMLGSDAILKVIKEEIAIAHAELRRTGVWKGNNVRDRKNELPLAANLVKD